MTFIPAVIITVGIIIISLWENPQLPPTIAVSDKWIHGLMYAVMAMAWLAPICSYKNAIWIILSTTVFGGVMELLQHYCTTTRSGEWLDLLADFIGALVGALIIVVITKLSHYVITKKSSIINHKS